MAKTHFKGPVLSENGFVQEVSTAAILADATAAVNKANKLAGKQVVDVATGLVYTATGTSATSAWKASDGTSSVTPA